LGGQERNLIHRPRMRSDQPVMPAAEPDGEALGDLRAQHFGAAALLWPVEIDMGVIAPNRVERLRHHGTGAHRRYFHSIARPIAIYWARQLTRFLASSCGGADAGNT